MKVLIRPLILMLTASAAVALEPYVPPSSKPGFEVKPLSAESEKKALEMLSSPSTQIRGKARTALRKHSTTDETRAQARELIGKAKAAHKAALEALVKRGVPAADSIRDMAKAWQTQQAEAMAKIRTAYDKDKEKLGELDSAHAQADKLLQVLDKELKSLDAAWKPIANATTPLEEMERDLALIDGQSASYNARTPESFLAELGAARDLLDTFKIVNDRRRATEELEAAQQHNDGCKWASKSQKLFVQILNQRRFAVKLSPLRLDERLSQAATDHSQEMITLGYFAHESPVAANKSPGDRAKNANFEGGWAGENIFAGSASPEAAYGAWWHSDGHRFIMFADGPNTAGVGPVASHWTLMTGRKTWPSQS